jgi:GxxExxY protein
LEEYYSLTEQVIGSAIEVHKTLGPGLLESVYQRCLAYELNQRNINFATEVTIPIHYKDQKIDCAFRADIIVENKIILELKAIEKILPIHEAQLITYLKLTKMRLGLILNFNTKLLKDGIKRMIL